MANTYLTRTVSSGADLTKWTWSCWVKRTDLVGGGNNYQRLISNEVSGNTKSWYIRFQNSTQFHAWSNNGAFEFTTNANYRDINGWYHLVVKYDSTQSTEADRFKVYVNGEQPSMANIHYPTLNETVNFMNTGNYVDIGYYRQGSSEYFYGLMSHMHFTAGYAYDASTFGSTDATTGEWKINTSPSVTYGSLGFFILKDGNSVTDQSGNSNNFTVGGGTLTKTEDNPSNVYTVWNANSTVSYKQSGNPIVFSNGATSLLENGGEYKNAISTLGAFTGKYYFETKMISPNNSLAESTYVGVVTATAQANVGDNYNHVGYTANSVGYNSYAGQVFTSDSGSNYGASLANGDILGVALDITNLKVYFSKNGVWQNSGVPTSGSTGTGAVSLPSTGDAWLFGGSPRNSSIQSNFGNGYFGTTAVSSAGTNASNNGIFEYDVPTGFTALSTKGLNL